MFNRILVVRTDRVGDVVLSMPAVEALRALFPAAYICMMVAPCCREIVEHSRFLDDFLLYDKQSIGRSFRKAWKFSRELRSRRFDVAFVLHPTIRAHVSVYFAGIPRRVGYRKKFSFLLTDTIVHTKHRGEKHETEYALDLLRAVGLEPATYAPHLTVSDDADRRARDLLREAGITSEDTVIVLHPAASCPSKIWPPDYFARAADELIAKYGCKTVVVSGPDGLRQADEVIRRMTREAVNLAGRTTLSTLAGIFKQSELVISNDSGPVHVASAVGAPVISIFGRKQEGLSPRRWGPLGNKGVALHKDVGCEQCRAHNCSRDFACLKAVTVEDVLTAADALLRPGAVITKSIG
jgi:lipopolysaccharide heptosyltransferase II